MELWRKKADAGHPCNTPEKKYYCVGFAFVCVNGPGIFIDTSKKSDEMHRHFSRLQNHPNPSMDYRWKCCFEIEGSSYRCIVRIAIETFSIHDGVHATNSINCNKIDEKISTSSKPILGPARDLFKSVRKCRTTS